MEFYYQNKDDIWSNPTTWKKEEPSGWTGFAARAERLASHYQPEEKEEFLRDFALVFAGVPASTSWIEASLSVAGGPHQFSPLEGTNDGLHSRYLDSLDPLSGQSHHYAGLLFFVYYVGWPVSNILVYPRDYDNKGDLVLGDVAIRDGSYFRRYGTYQDMVDRIRALAIEMDD